MNVTLPLWIVVSQWIVLFALGFLVVVMYRQMAYLLRLKDVGTARDGLEIGNAAPAFDYVGVNVNAGSNLRFNPRGGWKFIIFADPGCSSCEKAMLILENFKIDVKPGMQPIVVTTADTTEVDAIGAFRRSSLPIAQVKREVFSRLYKTNTTPFAYVVDPEGIVRGKGPASDQPSLRKIFRMVDQTPQVAEEVEAHVH